MRGRGRELQIDPSVERFSKEIERMRREDVAALLERGLTEAELTQTYLLEKMLDRFKVLCEVVNESTRRSEVIRWCAVVANTARQIAQCEWENHDGKDDVREMPD